MGDHQLRLMDYFCIQSIMQYGIATLPAICAMRQLEAYSVGKARENP
jgi:hypothetical protein